MSFDLTPRDQWAIETMRRHRAVLADLAAEAEEASDPVTACRLWLALGRQAASYHRYLDPWRRSPAFARTMVEISQHYRILEDHEGRAAAAVAAVDQVTQERSRRQLGLRLAVVGKGGAGKTLLASTVARLLAQRGRRVLAVDLDTNPGLTTSLGMPPTEAGLPAEVLEQDAGANYGWHLATGVSPRHVVERCSVVGPDGVRFLGVGKISSSDKEAAKQSVAALVQVLLGFGDPDWDVVADLEAGPTTPFERYHAFAHDTVVVVGPAWRSALTARRLLPMLDDQCPLVVANRFRDEPDHPGLAPVARIPFDPEVAAAERQGLAPMDVCPDAPALDAVAQFTERLLTR